jgi:uncharacterized protein (DUF1015 family)
MRLLRAIRTNTSPVFLIYRDHDQQIDSILQSSTSSPVADFTSDDGQQHLLDRLNDPRILDALTAAFEIEVLYIADGHHRYETALAYRDECRSAAAAWTGDEPENFAMVALAGASDPGLLVLPIHRVTGGGRPLGEVLDGLSGGFAVEKHTSLESLSSALAAQRDDAAFGLISADADEMLLLSLKDRSSVDSLLPQDRSNVWRSLDYAIANHAILQHGLGLTDEQMSDYETLWFSEDDGEALRDVRTGRARYAVLMNPVAVERVLDVADSAERMPQKSTFFYPKVPTGLVFNALDD